MTFNEWLNETGVDGYNLSLGDAFRAGIVSRDAEVAELEGKNFLNANAVRLQKEKNDQLSAELESARAEIERLNEHYALAVDATNSSIARSLECADQLAAEQAKNVGLRVALETISALGILHMFNGSPHWILTLTAKERADKALATPSDTSALEAMIAKAGEVMRERCAKETDAMRSMYRNQASGAYDGTYDCKQIAAEEIIEEIRALPGVKLEDLK